ncbi:DUF2570 family protein [Glaesserella parasuis]|nr:DUF2570 family protein [Glaesserella parasuis]MDP0262466.1 DUF2570 family protein [Glaesserella parasuis]
MFSWVNKILMALILGLCAWLWGQSQRIDSLTAENQTQAQTIEQQQKANNKLTMQLQQERQAVEYQQNVANKLRKQVEQSNEQIKAILQKEPCGVTALPRPVVDELKRLHSKDKD